MPDGFLLDAYPDPARREMVLWLKTDAGAAIRYAEPFTPALYARSHDETRLHDLADALLALKGVAPTTLTRARCGLEDHESPVLRIPVRDYALIPRLAHMIDARGNHRDLEVFDADLRMTHRYLLAKNLWPLCRMRAWAPGRYRRLEDDRWSLEYPTPHLSAIELSATTTAPRGTVPRHETPLQTLTLRTIDTTSRWQAGTETSIDALGREAPALEELMQEVQRRDPDLCLTRGGDTFLLPYLQARAAAHDLDFWLGRERDPTRPRKAAKSYFTYGRIKYQAPAWALHGRIHIDKSSSFFWSESGYHGIADLARISNVPIQDVARLGAGTALTAIQIDLAASQGRLIPWKKNVPEAFKTARDLLLADRGGYIYEPRVGLHEDVHEFDFASLYPNLMATRNISPETIHCACCTPHELPQTRIVPQLGTWTCGKRTGFIPTYIAPIVARREHYKRMRKKDPDRRASYQEICDAYKWLLVTSFGYQGYKNAKFGRIECHEAISAWGREALLTATDIARDHGFEFLHGIVDSLWIKRIVPGSDPLPFGETVTRELGIPFEHQGRFKWIVFLPTRSSLTTSPQSAGEGLPAIGALNRYYGCLDAAPDKPSRSQAGQPLDYIAKGAMKVRGVELRQHSTPRIVREAQERYLQVVSEADDARQFLERLPEAIAATRPTLRRVLDGACELQDLVFTASVSRTAPEYRALTAPAAAVKQLHAHGIDVPPGDTVRYVITDETSRDPHEKVRETRLMNGTEPYDHEAYARVILRAIASLTLPFGYDEPTLAAHLLETGQTRLAHWTRHA